MGFWSWLFGESEKPEPKVVHPKVIVVDPREYLASDEEWVTPEEWFVDTDGKKVRKKKKVSHGYYDEEETVATSDVADNMVGAGVLVVEFVIDPPVETPAEKREDPGFNDPDLPSSCCTTTPSDPAPVATPEPVAPAVETPSSYSSPSSDYSSSYDSGSSYSSYDSGSSGCSGCD